MTVNLPALDCGAGSPVRRVSGAAAVGLLLALVAGAPACAVRTWSYSSSLRPISPEARGAVPLMLSYTAFPASLPFFFASSMKTVYTAPHAGRGHDEIDLTASRTCD